MPGPAPKHPSTRARRNNAKKDFRVISAAGRKGAPPAWPLQPDVIMTARLEAGRDRVTGLQVDLEQAEDGRVRGRIKRELNKLELEVAVLELQIEQAADTEKALWAELWATPQAILWEEAHAVREVAQYVRWKIRAEQGDLKAAVEARQLSDRLGLNPLALLRLRVELERADEAEDQGRRRRQTPPASGGTPKRGPKKPPDDPRQMLSVVK